jgi:hypothetical protein
LYQGTTYGQPTDPSSALSTTGLAALQPQAFNADTLAAMFSPQGMENTPVNSEATNPFLQMYLDANNQATKMQRKDVGGMSQMAQNAQGGGGSPQMG